MIFPPSRLVGYVIIPWRVNSSTQELLEGNWGKAFWKMRCFQCGGTLPILGWSLSFETKRCWMSTPVFEWFCLTQSPLVASANNSHGGRWSCCLWRTVERTFAWPPRTTRKKGQKDEQSNATLFLYIRENKKPYLDVHTLILVCIRLHNYC